MRAFKIAAASALAIAIGLATPATAAFRAGGGGGGHFGGSMGGGGTFHGGGMMFHGGMSPAFNGGMFRSARGFPQRHAFAFDRGRFVFRHGHRRFFFAGAPFVGFGYGGYYGYDCNPYWNGWRWVYPYGYACGYGS
jgi:hypothetical protein